MSKNLSRLDKIKKAVALSDTLIDTKNYNKIIATLECIKLNGNLDESDELLIDSAMLALSGMVPGRKKTKEELLLG